MTTTKNPAIGDTTTPALAPRVWQFVAVLLVSIALPFIFLNEAGPNWFHLAFHLIGVPLCVLAVLTLARIRTAAVSRPVRVLTWVTTVTFTAWAIGHSGELVTVLTHGGAEADHHVFEHPVHYFFATIAVPSWLASVLASLALLITIGVGTLRRG